MSELARAGLADLRNRFASAPHDLHHVLVDACEGYFPGVAKPPADHVLWTCSPWTKGYQGGWDESSGGRERTHLLFGDRAGREVLERLARNAASFFLALPAVVRSRTPIAEGFYAIPPELAAALSQLAGAPVDEWPPGREGFKECLWMAVVHELAWQGRPATGLIARRARWAEASDEPRVRSRDPHPDFYYSQLPDTAFQCSAWAIDILLADLAEVTTEAGPAPTSPIKARRGRPAVASNDPRDEWIYGAVCDISRMLKEILPDLKAKCREEGWNPVSTIQRLSQIAKEYASKHDKPDPPRRRK